MSSRENAGRSEVNADVPEADEFTEETGQTQDKTSSHSRGEMIAVCSAKGGVGRTVLTANLAVALSKKNLNIAIVDADFQFGDVCLAMDLQPTFTMKDIVEEKDDLDEYLVNTFLNHHASGVKVLAAPERPEYADMVTQEVMDKVMWLLLRRFDYVLVDTQAGLTPHTLSIVEKADQIMAVTDLEMATLKNTKLLAETLDMLDMAEKVQVVVNRSDMESVIEADEVGTLLNKEIFFYIPNHFAIVSQSINDGIPFVVNQGTTEIAKAVFKMAEFMTSRRSIRPLKYEKPSLFKALFQKTKQLKEGTS